MTLPCSCEVEPDHWSGERLVTCKTHRRQFVLRAKTQTIYDVREVSP